MIGDPVGEALADAVGLVDMLGIPYFVFGALAVSVHGAPRQTLDADLTVSLPLERLGELVGALGQWRFSSRPADPEAFARRYAVLPVHHAGGANADLVIAGTAFEQTALARAVHRTILGVDVRVVSPEDLVLYKLSSDREKDHEDVPGILARQGPRLDDRYLEAQLREMEQAFDRSDLIAAYRDLVKRYRR